MNRRKEINQKIEALKQLEHKKFISREHLVKEIKRIVGEDSTIEELDDAIRLKKDKEMICICYKDFNLPLEVTEVSKIGTILKPEIL